MGHSLIAKNNYYPVAPAASLSDWPTASLSHNPQPHCLIDPLPHAHTTLSLTAWLNHSLTLTLSSASLPGCSVAKLIHLLTVLSSPLPLCLAVLLRYCPAINPPHNLIAKNNYCPLCSIASLVACLSGSLFSWSTLGVTSDNEQVSTPAVSCQIINV
jgi:hypothetical protein